jgi:hypothetical protein
MSHKLSLCFAVTFALLTVTAHAQKVSMQVCEDSTGANLIFTILSGNATFYSNCFNSSCELPNPYPSYASGQSFTLDTVPVNNPTGPTDWGQAVTLSAPTQGASGCQNVQPPLDPSGDGLGERCSPGQVTCSGVYGTWYKPTGAQCGLKVVSGGSQVGRVNQTLSAPLVVKVTNAGISCSGVPVSFEVIQQPSGATGTALTTPTAVTGGDGMVSTGFTLGSVAGLYQVTAFCSSCTPTSVGFAENASCEFLYDGSALQIQTAKFLDSFSNNIIWAVFTPGGPANPMSLADAAKACGFAGFNWQQTITVDPAPGMFTVSSNGVLQPDPTLTEVSFCDDPIVILDTAVSMCVYENTPTGPLGPVPLAPLTPPFLDPPLGGYGAPPGYVSDQGEALFTGAYPFYLSSAAAAPETPYTLTIPVSGKPLCTNGGINAVPEANAVPPQGLCFIDSPANPVLFPGLQYGCLANPPLYTESGRLADCFMPTAQADQFTTSLVGVLAGNTPGPVLRTWNWQSTFNGAASGQVTCLSPYTCAGATTANLSPPVNGDWTGV